jgi:hypothetical protein
MTSNVKNTDAPFLLVRPITTKNVSSKSLGRDLEAEVSRSLSEVHFTSPISGILTMPCIIDSSIVPLFPDYVGYKKKDNSVSVGLNLDFNLWERSAEVERLALLAANVRSSVDKVKSRYLVDADRVQLHHAIDLAEARLKAGLLN